jgi:regulator of sirC expression with transglutaminase-like and TPR domain
VTPASRLARFTAAVDRPAAEIELDLAALYIGDWDDEAIDVTRARAELDRIAGLVAPRAADEVPWSGARAIALTLFTDLGYRGNSADYYDPRNSFLSQVMARRTGIPITLSVLYLEVARRAGIDARGVGFPGHFLVRVHEAGDTLVVDPFNGGAALAPADLEALVKKIGGAEARLDDTLLAEASKPQILARMLLNLAGIYGKQGDLFRSLEVLERLHVLDRANPRLARDLEQLRSRVSALN